MIHQNIYNQKKLVYSQKHEYNHGSHIVIIGYSLKKRPGIFAVDQDPSYVGESPVGLLKWVLLKWGCTSFWQFRGENI